MYSYERRFSGVIDEVMKQIQFERRSHVGVEKDVIVDSYLPAKTHKPTTHLVDVDDKLRSTINKGWHIC